VSETPREELTPQEQRLLTLLEPLRHADGEPDPRLVRSVMFAVRWQHAVKEIGRTIGYVASAVADAARLATTRERSDT
jgi:hypothetical protein